MKLTLPAGSVENLGAGVVRVTLPGAASDPNTPTADEKAALAGVGNAPPDAANPFLSYADYSLALLLAESNDAGAEPITNLADPEGDQDAATKKYVDDAPAPGLQAVVTASPIAEGTILTNVDSSGTDTLDADGTRTISHGAGTLVLHDDSSIAVGTPGSPTFIGTSIRNGAGGAAPDPALQELPIAVDFTPVTGGLYIWDGAAWIKISTIP